MKCLFSKLFSVGKSESNDEIEKLIRFFEDESLQNDRAPKAGREKIIGGTSVDEIPGAFGEFGLTLTNPIPVNGAIGEVVYLSLLRHAGKTQIYCFTVLGRCPGSISMRLSTLMAAHGAFCISISITLASPRGRRRDIR
jgi:hypothetical protein